MLHPQAPHPFVDEQITAAANKLTGPTGEAHTEDGLHDVPVDCWRYACTTGLDRSVKAKGCACPRKATQGNCCRHHAVLNNEYLQQQP